MPELLLELFSEEIPARMQARGAEELSRAVAGVLAPVLEGAPRVFYGPRRIGLVATARDSVTTEGKEERGPRLGAPQAALDGFLRKHGATQDQLAQQNGFWVLVKPGETVAARALVARAMPGVIRGFTWPKSMRWNGPFTWVRPLHRVLCILDGEVVPFGIEDLPGVVSGNETEGHRVMAPGAVTVFSFASYEAELRHRRVILDAAERMALIEDGLAKRAAAQGVRVVPDRGLLEEVAGLVEWPVPLLGRIDDAFMDLPPEVMRTTMRVNQRYFATVNPDGTAAPWFGVVANIAASDGGAVLVAGNERVLRARLSDARFFWDQDRKRKLQDFLPKLDGVVFHAKLGTQGQRVQRLVRLAGVIAALLPPPLSRGRAGVGETPDEAEDIIALAERAALLCKADLASGMVGEFPELQGVMGRYYARHHGEDERVAEAIGAHYRPLGPSDAVPSEPVAIAVALADKLDTLVRFFAGGERPTGSGDPYALRRAALGYIRLLRDNGIGVSTGDLIQAAIDVAPLPEAAGDNLGVRSPAVAVDAKTNLRKAVFDFIAERLLVLRRSEGARHDILSALASQGEDLARRIALSNAIADLLESETGTNLLAAYKRAANILRIESKKDGPHDGAIDAALLTAPEEQALAAALDAAEPASRAALDAEDFPAAMAALAVLRAPLDAFFDRVTVNDPDMALRANRLRLLNRLRAAMNAVADFSKIEG